MTEMTTETKFEVGKYYKRGDGELVRVVCVDAPGDYPVIGHFECGDVETYTAEGSVSAGANYPPADLIPTPVEPKKKGVVWVSIYNDTSSSSYSTRRDADAFLNHMIARVRVPWEEGQFDDE